MIITLLFFVALLASLTGSICGIGGGVIIKPALDATGIMSVSNINFLSGCTVFAMSIVSVYKNMRNGKIRINIKTATLLAIGAAAGGIIGRGLFQGLKEAVGNEQLVGMIQAIMLIVITGATLIYTIWRQKIQTKNCANPVVCLIIGITLGIMSSFLGIGGGPVNLVMLSYFFSMTTKEGAISSLYIIMFSQAASLGQTFITHSMPEVKFTYFAVMLAGGILGGNAGSMVNKRIKEDRVNQLFIFLMAVIILINVYNAVKFGHNI